MSSAMDILIGATESKPYYGFSNLKIGHHEVVKFRLVRNKQYKSDAEKPSSPQTLLVELVDQVLFLPEYFLRQFGDNAEKVDELNNDGVRKFMFFGGRRENR